jgi:hypothetical protein
MPRVLSDERVGTVAGRASSAKDLEATTASRRRRLIRRAAVGGDDGGVAALVGGVDHLEEHRRGVLVRQRQQAHVDDDQHGAGRIGLELTRRASRRPRRRAGSGTCHRR